MKFASIGLCLALSVMGAVAWGEVPDRRSKFRKLGWTFQPGRYELPLSSSSVELPAGRWGILLGKGVADATRLLTGTVMSDAEAVLYHLDGTELAIVEYKGAGFVDLDGWQAFHPDRLLDRMRELNSARNSRRKQRGLPERQIVSWIREPVLNAGAHTVQWAIEIDAAGKSWIESTALIFGRHGYVKIGWRSVKLSYPARLGFLEALLKSHRYGKGLAYRDHDPKDAAAPEEVTSLVAKLAGAVSRNVYALLQHGAAIEWYSAQPEWLQFTVLGLALLFALLASFSVRALIRTKDLELGRAIMVAILFWLLTGLTAYIARQDPVMGYVVAGFLLAGGVFTAWAFLRYRTLLVLRRRGRSTSATIDEVDWSWDRGGRSDYVRYSYPAGGETHRKKEYYRRGAFQPAAGQSVEIVYDPERPNRAMMEYNLRV